MKNIVNTGNLQNTGIVRTNIIKTINDDFDDISDNNQNLSILGHVINIGNVESIVNIRGTTNYIMVNEIYIKDKSIALNVNNNDIGNSSGIEIVGINGLGSIRTSNTADRFLIKNPEDISIDYIATYDINDHVNISGNAVVNKSLYCIEDITSNNIIATQTITSKTVNISNNSYSAGINIFDNEVSINSTLTINEGIVENNFHISGVSNSYKSNIDSELYVSNKSFLNYVSIKVGTVTTDLCVLNMTDSGSITTEFINSDYLTSTTIITDKLSSSTSIYTNELTVSGDTIF